MDCKEGDTMIEVIGDIRDATPEEIEEWNRKHGSEEDGSNAK